MASCETQLWDLVRKIEPSQSQKDGAQRSHNYLREVLNTGQMASRILDSYLSGSYSRDTAIKPLDDVDIIFIIDPSKWQSPPGMDEAGENIRSGIRQAREGVTRGYAGTREEYGTGMREMFRQMRGRPLSVHPSPSAVLNTFANAIRYRYPVSSVYGQRRSVRLELDHLDIDVVPGILTNDEMIIQIPNRESDSWILTAPKKHAETATAVNKVRNGKFKPLVKLLKCWNGNLPSTASFKSFAIETMAIRIFVKTPFQSLEEGLLLFYDFVAKLSQNSLYPWTETFGMSFSWLECVVPDAAGMGSNTTAGVDSEHKKKFIENATRSRDRMVEARNAISVETACKRVAEALRI